MDFKRHCQQLKTSHILVVLSVCGLAASRHCDRHHYWDTRDRICRPCTRCPENEIIRRPCGRHSDTLCGPFREFSFFNQLDDLDSAYTSYEYEAVFNKNSSRLDHEVGDLRRSKARGRQSEPVVQKDDGEYWKDLAFSLIGVVCLLIFIATGVVLMACRKLHETAAALKRPEEDDDDDSGYVVIRSIRPPSMLQQAAASSHTDLPSAARALLVGCDDNTSSSLDLQTSLISERLKLCPKGGYVPVRHLLNYDDDDVFESEEDSAGSQSNCSVPQVVPKSATAVDYADGRDSVSRELPV